MSTNFFLYSQPDNFIIRLKGKTWEEIVFVIDNTQIFCVQGLSEQTVFFEFFLTDINLQVRFCLKEVLKF